MSALRKVHLKRRHLADILFPDGVCILLGRTGGGNMTSLHSLPVRHSLPGQLFASATQWTPMFQRHRKRHKRTAGWDFTSAVTLAATYKEGEDARI
jgi:hypothetical protein